MTVIKMLRTTRDNVFIGDRTYTVADPQADAMIKLGDAVLVERVKGPTPEEIKAAGGKVGKDAKAAKKKGAAKGDSKSSAKKPANAAKKPPSKKKK